MAILTAGCQKIYDLTEESYYLFPQIGGMNYYYVP